jgi:hypothetical protein
LAGLLVLVWGQAGAWAGPGLVDASASPHAAVSPVGLDEVRWTDGFWAERVATCRQSTLPGLWGIMEGTNYTHFYQNFRIAAGLSEGRHRGAPFNDGDFYKWLEGACASLAHAQDPELERHIEEAVGVIAKAQRQDGYIHTRTLIRSRNGDEAAKPFEDRLQFEMYNMGHLLTAACIHFRVTGRTNLLAVARRTADFLDAAFSRPTAELARQSICPSHYMGMVELYRTTRESRYLELARKFLAMRDLVTDGSDDNQDRIPFLQQTNAMGHAVRANYLYAGAADLFLETGDEKIWGALEQIWTNVVQRKMYITGGCGALYDGASPDGAKDQKNIARVHQAYGRDYQLPNLTAHNETCANIGSVLWNWRMYLASGQARFMDVVELALYNSVLSGGSLDGTNFLYVNPLRSASAMPGPLRWQHRRVPFMSSFCCPPNLARTIAEVGSYAYSKSADAIWINLYGSSRLSTDLRHGRRVSLSQETEYPWNGRVQVRVSECDSEPFALNLRIPSWAAGVNLRLNRRRVGGDARPSGYFEIRRAWRAGDIVEIEIPMPVRLMEANPFVEEALNQVAVQRGPLVYCLETAGLPNGLRVADVLLPADADLIARYDARVLGGVVLLEGQGALRPAGDWEGRLYRQFSLVPAKAVTLRLVPYYAWGNRGESDMTVWIPLAPSLSTPGNNNKP